jgi:hypothetical protein
VEPWFNPRSRGICSGQEWHCGRFLLSTFVSPANSVSTNSFLFIIDSVILTLYSLTTDSIIKRQINKELVTSHDKTPCSLVIYYQRSRITCCLWLHRGRQIAHYQCFRGRCCPQNVGNLLATFWCHNPSKTTTQVYTAMETGNFNARYFAQTVNIGGCFKTMSKLQTVKYVCFQSL